ncbi:hypothetical protein LCGC14_1088910 [marine sediment metagenome]|uniref:Uncharacterized protein n=1 Tax=marine sediment metagenome TaxID=412755 RepID=A0A0F9N0Q0_9ZZZZ
MVLALCGDEAVGPFERQVKHETYQTTPVRLRVGWENSERQLGHGFIFEGPCFRFGGYPRRLLRVEGKLFWDRVRDSRSSE